MDSLSPEISAKLETLLLLSSPEWSVFENAGYAKLTLVFRKSVPGKSSSRKVWNGRRKRNRNVSSLSDSAYVDGTREVSASSILPESDETDWQDTPGSDILSLDETPEIPTPPVKDTKKTTSAISILPKETPEITSRPERKQNKVRTKRLRKKTSASCDSSILPASDETDNDGVLVSDDLSSDETSEVQSPLVRKIERTKVPADSCSGCIGKKQGADNKHSQPSLPPRALGQARQRKLVSCSGCVFKLPFCTRVNCPNLSPFDFHKSISLHLQLRKISRRTNVQRTM